MTGRLVGARELAPDEGVSVDATLAEPPLSGASPLPHFDLHTSGGPQVGSGSGSGSAFDFDLKRPVKHAGRTQA